MYKRTTYCKGLLTACVMAGARMAKAGPDDAALLAQVKQLASQGQDAQTAAQVSKVVDQNQDAISAILNTYVNYLKQAQTMAPDDGTGTAPQAAPTQPVTSNRTGASGGNAATAAATTGGAASASGGGVQASNGLRMSAVQPSGGLQTSHLAGYPSLPDVDPVSAVTGMTAAQMAYSAQVDKDVQARKQYLMQHPEGYTY